MERLIVLVIMGLFLTTSGGIMTACVSADEPETVIESTGPETVIEAPTEETEEPETPIEAETVTEAETVEPETDTTPAGIIESQTGLCVDTVKQFDSYGNWAAYEVFADGDIYVVTIKAGSVDVCTILN